MAHVRALIRGAVLKLLRTTLTTIEGTNIFEGRVHAVQDPLELPVLLLVYAGGEDVRIASMGARRTQERMLEISIEALFKDRASLDAKADEILADVEKALATPGADLGGAKYAQLSRIDIERDGDGETPAARLRMVFDFPYYTAQGAPDVAL